MHGEHTAKLTLHVCSTSERMALRAAEQFEKLALQAIQERGFCSIVLSGGKTPLPLYELLASAEWVDRLPWEKFAIYWVDERCVSPDDPISNYGAVRNLLLNAIPTTRIYRIRGELPPEEAALAYENTLKEHFSLQEGEFPEFDIIILGLSPTGHMASLSLQSPSLQERKRIAIDEFVPATKNNRVTLTLPVLNNARACLFLVSGKDKHKVLADTLNLLAEPTLPAQLVRMKKGELIWIVDEAAALGK